MTILSAPDYYSSVSIAGKFGTEMKPILVDTNGQMYIVMTGQQIAVNNLATDYFKQNQNIGSIAGSAANLTVDQAASDRVIKGAVEGNFPIVALDASGVILSRMKGAASGDLILKILDDCGDTSDIEDWVEANDGLNPADNQVYVKQGTHSMALGIDADKSPQDYGIWTNSEAQGDLSLYKNDWIYLWMYKPTLTYLSASDSVRFRIGSGAGAAYLHYNVDNGDLSIGWNLLKFDLNSPDSSVGVVDWTAINHLLIMISCAGGNDNDFTLYFDCIMFVRPTPGAGTLKDIAVDENGIMLTKMTGQYADILKPIAIDQNGLMLAVMKGDFSGALKTIAVDTDGMMTVNLSAQGLPTLKTRPRFGDVHYVAITRDHPGIETYTIPLGVAGQGYVLGGYLRHLDAVSHKTCSVELIVDGVIYDKLSFGALNDYVLNDMYKNPVYEIKYDDTGFEYIVGFPYGLTFESTFVVKVYEVVGAASTRGGFFYSIFK